MNPAPVSAWSGTKTGRTGLPRPAEWPAGRDWSVTETRGRYLVRDPAGVLVGSVYHHPGGVWVAALVGERGGMVRGRTDQFTSLDVAVHALKSWWRQRAIDRRPGLRPASDGPFGDTGAMPDALPPRLQATVRDFDTANHSGSVLLDDGTPVEFDAAAFAAGGLRLLRFGQRVRLETDGERVTLITIHTLP